MGAWKGKFEMTWVGTVPVSEFSLKKARDLLSPPVRSDDNPPISDGSVPVIEFAPAGGVILGRRCYAVERHVEVRVERSARASDHRTPTPVLGTHHMPAPLPNSDAPTRTG